MTTRERLCKSVEQIRALLAEHVARDTFETVDQGGHGMLRRVVNQPMHVVVFAFHTDQSGFELRTDLLKDHSEIRDRSTVKYSLAYFVMQTR